MRDGLKRLVKDKKQLAILIHNYQAFTKDPDEDTLKRVGKRTVSTCHTIGGRLIVKISKMNTLNCTISVRNSEWPCRPGPQNFRKGDNIFTVSGPQGHKECVSYTIFLMNMHPAFNLWATKLLALHLWATSMIDKQVLVKYSLKLRVSDKVNCV